MLIVLFFPPLAFPGINLLEMDFKRDNWAVNVIVHQTTSQGICNRTITLYCISDSYYIILRRKALLNALGYLAHLKLISGAFFESTQKHAKCMESIFACKSWSDNCHLKAVLETLKPSWKRRE